MTIVYRKGDIATDFGTDGNAMILQQCNCTATKIKPNSFAYNLYCKLPYSNPYKERKSTLYYNNLAIIEHRPRPGSIKIMYSNNSLPIVCCLFAQYKMGLPNSKYYMNGKYTDKIYKNFPDDQQCRLEYFKICLANIISLFNTNDLITKHIDKIIIPRKIGCYSAGGNWKQYKNEIINFAKKLNPRKIPIYIIRYEN